MSRIGAGLLPLPFFNWDSKTTIESEGARFIYTDSKVIDGVEGKTKTKTKKERGGERCSRRGNVVVVAAACWSRETEREIYIYIYMYIYIISSPKEISSSSPKEISQTHAG